jgi:hypothetical protein
MSEGQRKGSRAGADVPDPRPRRSGTDEFEGGFDQELRLGSRDEDARVDAQAHGPELDLAEDVLKRLSVGAPVDVSGEALPRLGRQGPVAFEVAGGAVEPEDAAQKAFGVGA